MVSSIMIQILAFTILCCSSASLLAADPTFDVQSYGADPDGCADSTQAFLDAWSAACDAEAPATISVPSGTYSLGNASFDGISCKNAAITILINGTLVAPDDYNVIGDFENWLTFIRVTGVSIYGGTLDGQGSELYACKISGEKCPRGTTSLSFYNSENIYVNGITSNNSQMFQILVHKCNNLKMENLNIFAPDDSPNTDGIHVEMSSGVTILGSRIGTGDDCISMGPGATDVLIENVTCGPGHGVSIGSLGWTMDEPGVENVMVKSVNFTGSDNGVRIKTWARESNGFVRNVVYEHILMADVTNPIFIDQNYCPDNKDCPKEGSGVKISNVTYRDIRGTSATDVAVKLDCSEAQPCTGITLDEIVLHYEDAPANASCSNAAGKQTSLLNCLK